MKFAEERRCVTVVGEARRALLYSLGRIASGVLGLVILSAWTTAQVVLRQPTQILEDELATHYELVGAVVAVDGDALLVANPGGTAYNTGYILNFVQHTGGYALAQRTPPGACFTGPLRPPTSFSGITSCLFPVDLQVVGDTAVAASYGGDVIGGSQALGLVHVLQRQGDRWVTEQYIRGGVDDTGTATGHGTAVSFDGTTIAVRLTNYDVPGEHLRGAVALYERNGAGLFERVALVRPSVSTGGPPAGAPPGWDTARSVVVDQGVLAFSEQHYFVQRVRLYERTASGAWVETQVIERQPNASVQFGYEMSLDTEAGVLALSERAGEGRVWVYERDPVSRQWLPVAYLGPAEGSTLSGYSANFGWSLRVRGDMLAIGAPHGALQGQSSGVVEVYRRGPQGWARERRVAPPPSQFIPQRFGYALDFADGRLLVGAEWYTIAPGMGPGRAYLYQLTEGTLACAGPGNTADLHALFDDERDGRMQLSAFGLNGGGLGYFVAGPASGATPFGASELCVGGPRRISGPLAFPATADRVYAHVQHPDPTSPTSTAFQFVYRTTGSAMTQASVARIVD